jgi:hypothetical protein
MKSVYTKAIFIFTLCVSIHASGQKDVRRVLAVTTKGDTLTGYINDKNWSRNPSSFKIKTDDGGEKEFRASQLASVKIDSGDYYVSAPVTIDMNYVLSLDQLNPDDFPKDGGEVIAKETSTQKEIVQISTGKIETDTLFLRVLISSALSLYIFTDKKGKDHFYTSNAAGDFEELIHKNIFLRVDHANVLHPVSSFQNQLKAIMKSCASCVSSAGSVEFSEKKLSRLFAEFNASIPGNTIAYKSVHAQSNVSWQLIAGLDISTLSFDGNDQASNLGLGSYSTSYRPSAGIRLHVPITRARHKHAVLFELAWREYDTRASYTVKEWNDYDVHFQMRYLKLSPAYNFRFLSGKFTPYITLGGSMGALISSVNTKHVNAHDPKLPASYHNETDGIAYDNPINYDMGIFGTAGLAYKRFLLECRYEVSQGFSTMASLDSKVTSICIYAGYSFGKSVGNRR